ncbi:MAG: tetratricopeptide repeat protein [Bdellovibrionaceae bacterium]|nr:tetratricopeptide repeat protein [Bdellovibrio sp.]
MKKIFLITIASLIVNAITAQASDLKGLVSLQGETFNFELTGQKNWDYDIKRVKDKSQTKIQLYVKSLDQQAIDKIKNIENPFVKSIQVTPQSVDGKWLVEFVLKNAQVETFDYLTDQPSKLIVDFYLSDTPAADTTVEAIKKPVPKSKMVKKEKVASSPKSAVEDTANKSRRPADFDVLNIDAKSSDVETSLFLKAGLYDGGDSKFARFSMRDTDFNEESVIRSQNNYYLKFPILESEFSFWNKIKENKPVYEFAHKNNDENKQARLLKTLFDKKRYLVFIQTAEWFKNKFPESEYNESIAFMTSDAYLELWKAEKNEAFFEQAQNAYRQTLLKYPDSVLAERTSLLSGMYAVEKQDYMGAIRALNYHIENKRYADKISKQYAYLGLAHCYSKMNKVDEALKILALVEKETKNPVILAEVAVRRGDFYFNARKYVEAISAYEQAVVKHGVVAKMFPSLHFNKMEAYFWDKKYRDSHAAALEFVQIFPAHAFAPYALTRVGELLDIMGADQSKAVGSYLETHFRYGDSPKTIVARLHLLSARMKSMKKDELDETLKKMDVLAVSSELQNVDQFKIAMISDGFARRKEYPQAIKILSKFYQQNPLRADAQQVTQRIVRNINDELKFLVDNQKFKEVLKTYRGYSDNWLKGQNRIDTDYLIGLAYENAGAYNVSIEKFNKTLSRIEALKGTPREKATLVNEYLPSTDELYLKVAASHFENKNFQDAYQALEKIQDPLSLPETEQLQRVLLASKLYEQKGDYETSIRYLSELTRLWEGKAQLLMPALLRLAEMQTKKNDVSDAIRTYQRAVDIMLANETEAQMLHTLGKDYPELLIRQAKTEDAIKVLSQLINKFAEKHSMAQEKYLLGNLHFKNGEIKKAEQAWSQIKGADSDIWKKLSTEKLKQALWDEDYKKHIKRIPAMSQVEEGQ